MKLKPCIIGISGVGRSGKDTLVTTMQSKFKELGIDSERFALAIELKKDCEEYIKNNYNLSVWSDKTNEKSLFRQYLVDSSHKHRDATLGQYYWGKIENGVKNCIQNNRFPFISDVRFARYEGTDEAYWVKENGILIHIERYENGKCVGPASDQEEINDPVVKSMADLRFQWDTYIDKNGNVNIPEKISQNFMNDILLKLIKRSR